MFFVSNRGWILIQISEMWFLNFFSYTLNSMVSFQGMVDIYCAFVEH